MKISKSRLQRILREEVEKFISETASMYGARVDPESAEALVLTVLHDKSDIDGMPLQDLLESLPLSKDVALLTIRKLKKIGLVDIAGEGLLEPHELMCALTGDGEAEALSLKSSPSSHY